MTIRVTSAIIVSALIVVGLVFATASTVARDRAKHAEMLWLAYEDDNSKQARHSKRWSRIWVSEA